MQRKDVSQLYKWDTQSLFTCDAEWEKEYEQVYSSINFAKYAGKLSSKDVLLSCFKEQDILSQRVEKLYLYAHMLKDEDTRNSTYSTLHSKAQSLYVKLATESSFIVPEITTLSAEYINNLIADSNFSDYSYVLQEILKNKKHILSAEQEKLLSLGGDVFSSFKDIFSMIDNADLPLGYATDSQGNKVLLTHGNYGVILHGEDRALRKSAFETYYSAYIGLINTISSTYFGSVKKDVYITKARNYSTCLERALSAEDVDKSVYENLLFSVNKSLPIMHKYIAKRKELLGYDTMHMFDIYAPIVSGAEVKLPFDKAYDLVCQGLEPLGENYVKMLSTAREERWIDVEETQGKRSGAYCTSVYTHHPYVLLNYKPSTRDIFTIAHEMGHAMHSYYSNASQPYAKADYRIFVAEVASTVNEILLLRHMLAETQDKNIKKYLLSYFIDTVRTTLFRQTMFAEFEYIVHTAVEQNNPLSKDYLNSQYLKLNQKYYGNDIVSDEQIMYEWARIPHFYTPFYVYKYATGIISAILIADKILKEGKPAADKYLEFLCSGGSASPVDLLKKAGVDLTKTYAFDYAMNVFEQILDEFINI